MQAKKVSDSAVELAHRMMPQDANPAGNVHGGVLLKHIDLVAAAVAMRHARGHQVVTKSIDRMEFRAPVHVGELVYFKGSLNMVGTSSMEIGIRVESEDLFTGKVRHVASCYMTFIAMNQGGLPSPVPQLELVEPQEHRRFTEARERRRVRKEEREREMSSQHKPVAPAKPMPEPGVMPPCMQEQQDPNNEDNQ